ncbi:MAG: hypothetical protein ACOZNI_19875 [Myxococcota bacterium]
MSDVQDAGGRAEEAIRAFMLRQGYFAARGVRLTFDRDEATDIDIWAYGPGSPTHRERVVVDSKWKVKHAHGFERLVWLEGLRRIALADHAILATTDSRESIRVAAARMNVRVIGPEMFDELVKRSPAAHRLSEEEFLATVVPPEDKLLGRIREVYQASKGRLLKMDWDSVNAHMEDVVHYVEDTARRPDPSASLRLIYMSVAFSLINLDFILRDAAFMDEKWVFQRIDEGFRFGSRGRNAVLSLFETVGKKKRAEALRAVEQVRADIPAEFFTRRATTPFLFDVARVLEQAAYAKSVVAVPELPTEAQSVIGVVLDFLGVDRRLIFGIKVGP